MIVRVEDTRHEGRAVDLVGRDPRRITAAVAEGESSDAEDPLQVEAPAPGAVVRRVSPVTPATTVSVGPLLAAVGRSRGLSAPQDERIAAVREELSALDPGGVDGRPARRRAATVGDREAALRERVAELRGRLSAHRESGSEAASELQERLRSAVRELTEARTERMAAEQQLDRTERRARDVRDERERRLRLTDERDNLRRAAREHFLDCLGEAFHDALRAVPGPAPAADAAGFAPRSVTDEPTAALAAVRLAEVTAPVVVACGRFESASAAADVLAAPVIRVEPG